jgi:hypothetical protein
MYLCDTNVHFYICIFMSKLPPEKILEAFALLSAEEQQVLLDKISKTIPKKIKQDIRSKPNFVPGTYQEGDDIAQFAGLWANTDITLQSIREKA